MEIGNNNLESRESTAGIQTRCSWSRMLMFGPPKLGLEEEALRPRHQLWTELIGLIGCRTDVCLMAGQHCTEEGSVRSWGKTSRIFQQWNLCYLVQGLRFPENHHRSSNRNSWKGEKVYWTAFSGGSGCVRKKTMKLYQGGVKESATAISWSNQNSFTRKAVTQKNSNRITYNQKFLSSKRKAASSREKRKETREEKLCWNWPKESCCSKDLIRFLTKNQQN